MRRLGAVLVLALTIGQAAPLGAQGLDPAAGEALATTMRMLLDPTQRASAIAGSPQAGAVDQNVRALTGSDALTQELYALAATILGELAQGSGGDVTKMTQALERGPLGSA